MVVHSEFLFDFFSSQIAISENLGEKTSSDGFSTMYRDYSTSSIRMLEEMMTAPLTNIFKPEFPQGFD
jgi:hypothetical protein